METEMEYGVERNVDGTRHQGDDQDDRQKRPVKFSEFEKVPHAEAEKRETGAIKRLPSSMLPLSR